jgi:hypothetical protein
MPRSFYNIFPLLQSTEDISVRIMAVVCLTYVIVETGLLCWIADDLSTQVGY